MRSQPELSANRREYLKSTEFAEVIGVHPLTLSRWRKEGIGPQWVRFGRSVRYHRSQAELATPISGSPAAA